MIPLRDDQGPRGFAVATVSLVLAILVIHGYEWTLEDQGLRDLTARYGVRARSLDPAWQAVVAANGAGKLLAELPGLLPDLMRRVVVPMVFHPFFHCGPIHAVSNAIGLWVFGSRLEAGTSWLRVTLFFLIASVSGGVAQVVFGFEPALVHIGASAPVGSLALGYLILHRKARLRVLLLPLPLIVHLPVVWPVSIWAVLQLHQVQDFLGHGRAVSVGYVAQGATIVVCGGVLAPFLLGLRRRTSVGTTKSGR